MGTLLAAIFAAGGSIITGILNNNAAAEAQQEARRIHAADNERTLKFHNDELGLARQNQKLQRRQVAFARDAELYGRAERATERGMIARNNSAAQAISIVNSNEVLKGQFLNNWRRAA